MPKAKEKIATAMGYKASVNNNQKQKMMGNQ